MNHIDFLRRDFVAVERNAFVFEEPTFPCDEFTVAMTGETAEASVGGDDTVARHFRRERITPQRLPDSLRRPATDAPRQLTVGYHLTARDEARGIIDFLLEGSDFRHNELQNYKKQICLILFSK